MATTVMVSGEEYEELLLSKKIVDNIFEQCKAYDWASGRATFCLNEDILKAMFPNRYKEVKEKVENEYKEANKQNA